ncbi:hypothetical protein, partial [Klebsiella pneumoniae]|uniref:hypothetical protein n=1 Tax=Klebsiella pneumoniae TaxID=573 RepID=UPI002731C819
VMALCFQACKEELAREKEKEQEGEDELSLEFLFRPRSAVQYSFGRLDPEDSEDLATKLAQAARIARNAPDEAARFEPQALRV